MPSQDATPRSTRVRTTLETARVVSRIMQRMGRLFRCFWFAVLATLLLSGESAATEEAATTDARRDFWSFRELATVGPPEGAHPEWSQHPVDRFVFAAMRQRGLRPNPAADARTLVRRLYLDLVGVPPTYDEVERHLADSSDDAYGKLVERLLASPRHGERWARHWLDVARFAESHGFEHDHDRPFAFHFRDFVIRAFAEDMPYEQFVRWQLAGDEIAPNEPSALMATGFLGAGVFPTQITAKEVEPSRYDALDDMLSTTGTAVLGLSIGCARCHDHKFDPISAREYYRLLATFTTTVRSEVGVNLEPERYHRELAAWQAAHTELERKRDALPEGEARKKASDAVAEHSKRKPHLPKVQVTTEGLKAMRHATQGRDFFDKTFILARGDVNQKTEEATQGFLGVLMRNGKRETEWQVTPPEGSRTSYRRRSLARWLVDVDDGAGHLAARVAVNRIWQHHFGRGLVATPNDFGTQGARPSHPELLDWLARHFVATGWSLKAMHKLLVTSAAYKQSSAVDAERSAIDPENESLWRFRTRRLEAEAIRDAALVTTGSLDARMLGPGTLDERMRRRSVYFHIKRSRVVPFLQAFDYPEPLTSQAERTTTTVASQALFLLNHPATKDWSNALASTARERSDVRVVRAVYRSLFSRDPTDVELGDGEAFLAAQEERYRSFDGARDAANAALQDFVQTLLCTSEFLYLP